MKRITLIRLGSDHWIDEIDVASMSEEDFIKLAMWMTPRSIATVEKIIYKRRKDDSNNEHLDSQQRD